MTQGNVSINVSIIRPLEKSWLYIYSWDLGQITCFLHGAFPCKTKGRARIFSWGEFCELTCSKQERLQTTT